MVAQTDIVTTVEKIFLNLIVIKYANIVPTNKIIPNLNDLLNIKPAIRKPVITSTNFPCRLFSKLISTNTIPSIITSIQAVIYVIFS